jgi:cell division protein FtsW (lipid II flippase)
MNLFSRVPFLQAAAAPLAAGLIVLSLALFLGVAGQFLDRWIHGFTTANVIALLALIGIATPLLTHSSAPHRWVPVGALNLYIAPLLLPSFFAACSVYLHKQGKQRAIAFTALIGASVLLAIQPDASQVLALLAGSVTLFRRYRTDLLRSTIASIIIALVTVWAFTRPDPLKPVPHVEGVFALAFEHSLFTGCVVIASAIILIVCLVVYSRQSAAWLAAVAAYYATLFGCSVAGLTPAPLIGYGAGPVLGFGLMAAVSGWIELAVARNLFVPNRKLQS